MEKDRIVELRVIGMRCIKDSSLRLNGLTVLIGENGSGKSTFLEACEILRKAAEPKLLDDLYRIHGGAYGIGVSGPQLGFKVVIEGEGPVVSYFLGLTRTGQGLSITSELIQEGLTVPPVFPLARHSETAISFINSAGSEQPLSKLDGTETALSRLAERGAHPAIDRVAVALRGIRLHLPFRTQPSWAERAVQQNPQENPLRGSTIIQPATELGLMGSNLPNAYQALRNDLGPDHWRETLDLIRLGLGDRVEDVSVHPDPGGGRIALKIKYSDVSQHVPAMGLSDGTLAFLGFVALARLNRGRTLLAFDEPDLHLHPALLGRVLGLFEAMAKDHPVILSTHSDSLLDSLEDPVSSALLCMLDEQGHTTLKTADEPALREWMKSYRGLGDIRSSGNEAHVMKGKA